MSTPDRIKISKEFHVMGSGLWLSIEMPIAPGEDEVGEFKKGDAILTKAFASMTGQPLPTQTDYHSGPTPEIQVEKIEIGDLPAQIQSCKELKVLDSYKLLVRGKPELEKLYFDKLEELSK